MPCSKSLRCGVIIMLIESLRPGAAPRIEKWNHVCDLVWLGCPSQSVRAHTTKSFSPHCSTRPRFPESKSALQMRPPTLRSAVRSAVGKLLAARAADAVAGSSGMQVAIGRVTLRAVGLQAATAAKRVTRFGGLVSFGYRHTFHNRIDKWIVRGKSPPIKQRASEYKVMSMNYSNVGSGRLRGR